MSKNMRQLINEFKKFNGHRKILTEVSLSRIWQHIQNDEMSFGAISAYRNDIPKEKNIERHRDLRQKVRDMGLGYIEMEGGSFEGDVPVHQPSLFIPGITEKQIIELGRQFDQQDVIYKDKNKFVDMSTNFKDGIGTVLMDFIKKGWDKNITFDKEITKDVFSALAKGSHRGKKFGYNKINEEYLFEVIDRTTADKYRGIKYNDTDLIKLL